MTEIEAEVVAPGPGYAWVRTRPASACARCRAGQGCGRALLSGLAGEQDSVVKAVDRRGVASGDTVTVTLADGALMTAALWLYAVPLAGLIAGAVAGHWSLGGDGATLAGSGLGLAAALALTRRMTERRGRGGRCEPVISPRRVETAMPRW